MLWLLCGWVVCPLDVGTSEEVICSDRWRALLLNGNNADLDTSQRGECHLYLEKGDRL